MLRYRADEALARPDEWPDPGASSALVSTGSSRSGSPEGLT